MITNMDEADTEMAELFRQAWEIGSVGALEVVDEWDPYNPASTSSTSFATANVRIVLDKSLFAESATKIRLSFDGPIDGAPSQGDDFTAVVGLAASGGNPWDFASAPIPVLFSGVAELDMVGVLIGSDANRYVSDEIDLVIDGTADVIVSMTYAAGSVGASVGTTGIPANTWHAYLNPTSDDISALAPAGLLDIRTLLGDNQQWALSVVETASVVPGYKVDWPNMKTPDHEEDETWARWALDYVGGRQSSMGGEGGRKFTKMGLIYITVFTPLGVGLRNARQASQIAVSAYEGKRTPSDVWFRNVRIESEGHGQGTGRNKSWWTTQVVAEFIYDYLR